MDVQPDVDLSAKGVVPWKDGVLLIGLCFCSRRVQSSFFILLLCFFYSHLVSFVVFSSSASHLAHMHGRLGTKGLLGGGFEFFLGSLWRIGGACLLPQFLL